MKITLQDGLPYITTTLTYRNQDVLLENVLLDTGSAGTIFSADKLLAIDLKLETHDTIHRIRGVGGTEFVFTKKVDGLIVGELQVRDFEIEVGAMEYGFGIDGIIGMDFLAQTRAIIDLADLEIYATSS